MPIRREDRKHYGHHWRNVVRVRILRRAGGSVNKKRQYTGGARCEKCNVIDGAKVVYHVDYPKLYFVLDPQLQLFEGAPIATGYDRETGIENKRWTPGDLSAYIERRELRRELKKKPANRAELIARPVMVVVQIGVAHLNHTPGDDRPSNLRALCRRCHLRHDEDHHRESRVIRKDAARPLLRLAHGA